jgi:hypothetical protein
MSSRAKLLFRWCTVVLLATANLAHAHGLGTDEMADDATALLQSLPAELRARANPRLTSPDRKSWSPAGRPAAGVRLDELTASQRKTVQSLLRTSLSESGYAAVAASLDDPAVFTIAIFGTPGADRPWAWRVDSPTLALNFTVADEDNVALTPAFFVINNDNTRPGSTGPSEFDQILVRLQASLSAEQLRAATVRGIPAGRFVTADLSHAVPPAAGGLPYARMTVTQREQLVASVTRFIRRFSLELADQALNRIIAAGWDQVELVVGETPRDAATGYRRIQGPTFVIECLFDNRDPGRTSRSVWRDFDGDFGRDLLNDNEGTDRTAK